MAFKKNVLLVFLAAGLFLSPLSGCNGDKSGYSVGEVTPGTEVVKSAEITKDEQKKALEALDKVEKAVNNLKTYADKIDPNQALPYKEAKTKVDDVYDAYQEFRENLPEPIKTKSNFSDVDQQVEELFKKDNDFQKILANLVDGDKLGGSNDKYKAAQKGLLSLELTDDDPTGEDGYATKFATQELLEKIVKDTETNLNSLETFIKNPSITTPPATTPTTDENTNTDTRPWSYSPLVISLLLGVVVVGIIIFKRRKKSSPHEKPRQGSEVTQPENIKDGSAAPDNQPATASQQKKKPFPWSPLFSIFDDITEIKEQLDNISGNIVPESKLLVLLEEEINSQTNHEE